MVLISWKMVLISWEIVFISFGMVFISVVPGEPFRTIAQELVILTKDTALLPSISFSDM
jgi:hypothetical protein